MQRDTCHAYAAQILYPVLMPDTAFHAAAGVRKRRRLCRQSWPPQMQQHKYLRGEPVICACLSLSFFKLQRTVPASSTNISMHVHLSVLRAALLTAPLQQCISSEEDCGTGEICFGGVCQPALAHTTLCTASDSSQGQCSPQKTCEKCTTNAGCADKGDLKRCVSGECKVSAAPCPVWCAPWIATLTGQCAVSGSVF